MERLAGLAAIALASLLAACASGGGGGGVEIQETPKPSEDAELRCLWFLPIFCTWVEPEREVQPAPTANFISWSATAPFTTDASATSIQGSVTLQVAPGGVVNVSGVGAPETRLFNLPSYDAQGKPDYSETFGWFRGNTKPSLGNLGQPGIDLGTGDFSSADNPFADFAHAVAMVANPYSIGWNYQSFGVWGNGAGITGISYGSVTPAASVPPGGTALFTGKLAGIYVSPTGRGSMAYADLSVNADFGARSLALSSSGTFITRNLDTKTDAPHLNLSGTLSYSPGSNSFSGSLTNASGTMTGASKGVFYGPGAEELGGVFALRSPSTTETMAGAYGAKR